MPERDLVIRTKIFAYNVYWMVKDIKQDTINRDLTSQLIVSAFSAAANYRASQSRNQKKMPRIKLR